MEWIFFVKLVKVLIADFRGNLRDVRWSQFSHTIPVNAFEKWMSLNLIHSISSKSRLSVTYHPLQNICGSLRQVGFWRYLKCLAPVHDFLAGNRRLVREEWWITHKHFEEYAAHGPPIHCLVIALLAEDLRGNVVRSTHCRERQLARPLVAELLVERRLQLVEVERKLLRVDLGHTRRSDLSMFTQAEVG